MEDFEIIREFLTESSENLSLLDQELIELEQHPDNAGLLANIFRTIHTIKGTCGFLGFTAMEDITHLAESLLAQVRNGSRCLDAGVITGILQSVDAIRGELNVVERTGAESGRKYPDLIGLLKRLLEPPQELSLPSPGIPVDGADFHSVEPPAAPSAAAQGEATIRVNVHILDELMNLAGELVLTRNQILQVDNQQEGPMRHPVQRLDRLTTKLQETVMQTRMQPVSAVARKLPRLVRDLSASLRKLITLELEGVETEIDKTILEAIQDPLLHIIRNACDHGIEPPATRNALEKPAAGCIRVRAFQEGAYVQIAISDDGKGIDPESIRVKAVEKGIITAGEASKLQPRQVLDLIFEPGFSTASEITNISGRGVGMDVVRRNIERVGGVVEVSSHPGQGSTFTIKVPLTLAIIPGLVVRAAGQRYILPQAGVVQLLRLESGVGHKAIENVHGTYVYRWRGRLLPVASLAAILNLPGPQNRESFPMAVVQIDGFHFGLILDAVEDTQEIVVKPLGRLLQDVTWYAGTTVMGDGAPALILDVRGIAKLAGLMTEAHKPDAATEETGKQDQDEDRQSYLVFRAGAFERLAIPLGLLARLERIPAAAVEQCAGRSVVQYGKEILPLVHLADTLGCLPAAATNPSILEVAVLADGLRRIGLTIDAVIDIVEDKVTQRKKGRRFGILGSVVLAGKVTDLVDVQAIINAVDSAWFALHPENTASRATTVLLVDPSAFARGILRSHLELAGFRVIEAATSKEAIEKLQTHAVTVIALSENMPSNGESALAAEIARQPHLAAVPVLLLTEGEAHLPDAAVCEGIAELSRKFDRQALVASITRLAESLHGQAQPQCSPQ